MGLKSLQLGQQVLQGEGCEGHTWGSDPKEHLQGAVRRWVRAQTLGAELHVAGWGGQLLMLSHLLNPLLKVVLPQTLPLGEVASILPLLVTLPWT